MKKPSIKIGDRVRNTYHRNDEGWPLNHEFVIEDLKSENGQRLDKVCGLTASNEQGWNWLRDCELVRTKEELENENE